MANAEIIRERVCCKRRGVSNSNCEVTRGRFSLI